ncbi:MAG: carbon storage regulator [Bdellovibrionales bacterium]|nr:carbon storage regulator [Bdellovibrionales bacterium]
MLVLTRKIGEVITIDGNIKIQIVQVRGQQVRVGIEAPRDKKIQREELRLGKQDSRQILMNDGVAKTL